GRAEDRPAGADRARRRRRRGRVGGDGDGRGGRRDPAGAGRAARSQARAGHQAQPEAKLRAALAFALVALLPALGSAQDREYRVREGDTCGSIARRVYGDSRRYDRIHAANPQLGPMPHHLEPGTRLVLPAAGERASDATVTAVRRQVASQPPRVAAWSRARVGQELGQGWRVNTEARSSAELTFRASSVVAIRERTLVIVYGEGVRPAEESSARAVVREGSMLSRL